MLLSVIEFGNWWTLLFLLIGLVLGWLALWLDHHVLYRYYNAAGEETPYLLSRSMLFLLVLLPLSIFVASSTHSALGQGLVISLLGGVWIEMMKLRADTFKFNKRFAQKAKKPFTDKEVRFMTRGLLMFILLIIVIVLV
jgi:hypothetical protein